ncbi:glycosidase CRH1 [Ogataea parapolymorpha DL-1]|uniref:Crh-like protein n=1 Tax=Ogataea parapolymorpha (strain ATCC 26012 / BCRC 20466 / JCM 22074 / NRRL Y-7560 / DL-1) TaxID=871575 RepID=W1QEJ3_OGAPD|nr:glycosidase CRH1 [Ogataea parapolymorpha DL-1]ESW99879.1 glycosidase CRH1 [Ogataea parapolymorpha DL-1]
MKLGAQYFQLHRESMRSPLLSHVLLGSLVSGLAAAATGSSSVSLATATCNPLKTTGCPADTALAGAISEDFKSASEHFSVYSTPDQIFYSDEGLQLTLAKRFDNPALRSNFYIMFGKVEVLLKAANGTGIISSFYLQSDDLDEIDLEWFGGDGYEVQTNYFSKGNTATYDRGGYHNMDDPRAAFHNYTIDWTAEALTWYVDGKAIRTLTNDSSQGYPQSPMYLMMGIWAGGDSTNSQGTIEWAGGSTNYDDAPFSMYIKKVVAVDYSNGSEYRYEDTSGQWTSIEAVDGQVNGRIDLAEEEFDVLVAGGTLYSEDSDSQTGSSSNDGATSSHYVHESSTKAGNSSDNPTATASGSHDSVSTSKRSITSDKAGNQSSTTLETLASSSATASGNSSSQSVSSTNGSESNHSFSSLNVFVSLVSAILFGLALI